MRIILSINFLLFIAFLFKLSIFWVNRNIAFDWKTEAGKKNVKQTIIDLCLDLFLFFFIPANFTYMTTFEDEGQKLTACGIYFLVGVAPSLALLWIMGVAKHKQEEIKSVSTYETANSIVEVENKTLITETEKVIPNETKQ